MSSIADYFSRQSATPESQPVDGNPSMKSLSSVGDLFKGASRMTAASAQPSIQPAGSIFRPPSVLTEVTFGGRGQSMISHIASPETKNITEEDADEKLDPKASWPPPASTKLIPHSMVNSFQRLRENMTDDKLQLAERRNLDIDEREHRITKREQHLSEGEALLELQRQREGLSQIYDVDESVIAREIKAGEREADITQRESGIAVREAAISTQQSVADDQREQIRAKFRQLQTEDRELADRQQQVLRVESRLRQAEGKLAERTAALTEREAQLSVREDQIKIKIDEGMKKLMEKEVEISMQEEHLRQESNRLREKEANLISKEEKITRELSRLAGREEEVSSLEEMTRTRSSTLNVRDEAISRREQHLRDRETQLDTRVGRSEEQNQYKATQLDSWSLKLKRREAQGQEIDATLDSKRRLLEEQRCELDRRSDRLTTKESVFQEDVTTLQGKHDLANKALRELEAAFADQTNVIGIRNELRDREGNVSLRERVVTEREGVLTDRETKLLPKPDHDFPTVAPDSIRPTSRLVTLGMAKHYSPARAARNPTSAQISNNLDSIRKSLEAVSTAQRTSVSPQSHESNPRSRKG